MEIRLILFPDSTYHLYDNIGCNRFDFTGRFSSVSSDSIWDICIIRSVNRNEPIMPKHYPIIKINRNDTIAIFFKKRLLIDGNSFIKKRKIWDSYLIRSERKYLVEYYVKILGKKGFIEMLAKGESMKEAKRNIMKCMKAEEVPTVDSLFKNQSMLLNR